MAMIHKKDPPTYYTIATKSGVDIAWNVPKSQVNKVIKEQADLRGYDRNHLVAKLRDWNFKNKQED